MSLSSHWSLLGALTALACLSLAARAQSPEAPPLGLDEAATLAVARQPLLDAARAQVRAAGSAAIAAGQLPDPELIAGIAEVPLEGGERYSLTRDTDTELQIGLRQRFPGGDKRRLRGRLGELDAERLDAEREEQQRMIEREAHLAWLDVWVASSAQRLVRESLAQAQRQRALAGIAYETGRGSQEQLLAAEVEQELMQDRLAKLQQDEWHARNQLRRWIGDAAERELSLSLPLWNEPSDAHLLSRLERHPHLRAQERAIAAADTAVELARQDYRPDWSLRAGYGHRREDDDIASVEVEIALPIFTARRQDASLSARSAERDAAEAQREDWLRQHQAEIRLNVDDWRRLAGRLQRYDDIILPRAQSRLEAAFAAYGAGAGSMAGVLEARRGLLDAQLMRLDLQLDAARHQVQLRYFAHDDAAAAPAQRLENPS